VLRGCICVPAAAYTCFVGAKVSNKVTKRDQRDQGELDKIVSNTMSILLKVNHRFNTIPIKISMVFLMVLGMNSSLCRSSDGKKKKKNFSKFLWTFKGPLNSKSYLENE
jgi:hypothetical protein